MTGGSVGVREYWRLYRVLAGAYVRSRLQYRLSFWLGVFVTMITDLVPLLLIGIVFTRFPTLHGWHWRDIALLYGLDQLAFGMVRCFSRQIDNFDNLIVSGDFDSILIRPLPPLFHLLAARFEIVELGRLSVGVIILVLAARAAGIAVTAANVVVILGAVIGGAMILFSFILMVASVSFWQTRVGKLQDLVQASGRAFADYPLSIYPTGVRWLLTFGLPLALITYYPGQRLMGRNESGALLPVLSTAAVPAGLALLGAAGLVWRAGLRHYKSTGS
jgi:ABC-2 type transport system permease protein